MNALAGLTFVSHAVLAQFELDWPAVTIPRRVVANGFDARAWRPERERTKTVLAIGRVTPGERAAGGGARGRRGPAPSSRLDDDLRRLRAGPLSDYFAAIVAALAPLGPQARLLVGRPFEEVKALNERAAIAIAPSVWREPFGRTCLEAHAGGAAVVSSGTGGLREISGEAALFLSAVEPMRIVEAVEALMVDEPLRERLAADGRARVERLFDVRRVSAALDDSALKRSRGRTVAWRLQILLSPSARRPTAAGASGAQLPHHPIRMKIRTSDRSKARSHRRIRRRRRRCGGG